MKQFVSFVKTYKSLILKCLPLVLLLVILPFINILTQEEQDNRQRAAESQNTCIATPWRGIPAWLKKSDALGNATISCPEGNTEYCQDTQWDVQGILPVGSSIGHGGASPHFIFQYGAILPVAYDGNNDKIRFDTDTDKEVESSWAKVIGWTDETMKANPTLNPDVVLKHQIARLKKEVVRAGKNPFDTGFDMSTIIENDLDIQKLTEESKICQSLSAQEVPYSSVKFNVSLLVGGIGDAGDSRNRNLTEKGNSNPLHPTRKVTVTFLSGNSTIAKSEGSVTYKPTTGTFDGTLFLPSTLQPGTYTVRVEMEQYLATLISEVLVKSDGVSLPPIALITGDIDGNNQLDVLDFNALLRCHQDINKKATACTQNSLRLADLNDDGKVNQLDYNLLYRELLSKNKKQ